MKTLTKTAILVIAIAAILSAQASAAPLLYDDNYQIENYASYSSEGLGAIYGSGFDGQGNLYVTYQGTSDVGLTNGSIAKITPTSYTTRWADGIKNATRVVSTTGTAYGDNLYVVEYGYSRIRKVDSAGNHTPFTSVSSSPVPLALDRNGNYGGMMYTGTTSYEGIYSISSSGAVSRFGSFPGNISGGGPLDIEFAPLDKYGGKMFVGMRIYSGSDMYLNGIFSIDTQGAATRFAPSINSVSDMAFDTLGSQFNNDLFVVGLKDGVAGNSILRVDESGNVTPFALLQGGAGRTLAFGPDGAMYVSMFNSAGQTDIWKISEVPEPASLLLLGLGGFLVRKRKLL